MSGTVVLYMDMRSTGRIQYANVGVYWNARKSSLLKVDGVTFP
jgi:hypothetical protein